MKSTHIKAITAYYVLVRLGRMQIPTPVAYKLYKLRQKLKVILDFVNEQEKAIMTETGVTADDSGRFQFGDDAEREKFTKDHDALLYEECEIEGDPPVISLADLPEKLTNCMDDLEALDEFVRFE